MRREPNFILFTYKKIMSFIFLVASGVTLFLYALKVYALEPREVGCVRGLLFVNLVCLLIYNFLYSCGTRDHWASNFADNLINSVMMSLVLLLNLVLIGAANDNSYMHSTEPTQVAALLWIETKFFAGRPERRRFLLPKILICASILVVLHSFMYTHNARLFQFLTQLTQISDSIETQRLFSSFDVTDAICLSLFSVYGAMALKSAGEGFLQRHKRYNQQRSKQGYNLYSLIFLDTEFENLAEDLALTRFSSFCTCGVSILLLALLFMPPTDEMLQFADESGLINVYMIVLSFLTAPVSEADLLRFQAEREAVRMQAQLYSRQLKALASSTYSERHPLQGEHFGSAVEMSVLSTSRGNKHLDKMHRENQAI